VPCRQIGRLMRRVTSTHPVVGPTVGPGVLPLPHLPAKASAAMEAASVDADASPGVDSAAVPVDATPVAVDTTPTIAAPIDAPSAAATAR